MRHRSESNSGGTGDEPLVGALDALGDRCRQVVLERLLTREGPVSVHDLAADLGQSDQFPADRRRVVVDLHHRLLPRLDDAGYVTYDPGELVVVPNPVIEELEPTLEFLAFKRAD